MSGLKLVRWGIGIAALVALGVVLWFATRSPPLTIQGEVSTDRVDLSPRVSGRVAKLNADVGDKVSKGDVIVVLESPQLSASLLAAKAALAVAKASLANIETVRPEEVAAKKADLASAAADVVLAQQTFDRQKTLAAHGNASQAQLDQATRDLEDANRKRDSAAEELKLTTEGASKEQRALAAAQVDQASATLAQTGTDISELTIKSPVDAEVTTRVAELGENFSPGAPLFSLVDMSHLWFTFNLREDLLGGLKIGDQFDVMVPALKGKIIPVKVTLINVQGQYATWRATRATGDFDLRTFEVRAQPAQPIDGLRPGMSAVAKWSRGQ